MNIDDYMTVSEAAHRWGISKETVKNKLKPSIVKQEVIDEMVDQGLIKYFQNPGSNRREWIISKKAMEKWFGDIKRGVTK